MKVAICKLVSASPYSQSKVIKTPKSREETSEAHEERVWRERCHVGEDGRIFIPPTCFKNALSEAAKYNAISIPGKGKSTYTKHFEAGVICHKPLMLPIKIEDVDSERVFVPSDGKRGGGKRVWKTFPLIASWSGEIEFLIVDEVITKEVFHAHLIDAGQFIGIGRFRPRNNGYYGRFAVESVEWK